MCIQVQLGDQFTVFLELRHVSVVILYEITVLLAPLHVASKILLPTVNRNCNSNGFTYIIILEINHV